MQPGVQQPYPVHSQQFSLHLIIITPANLPGCATRAAVLHLPTHNSEASSSYRHPQPPQPVLLALPSLYCIPPEAIDCQSGKRRPLSIDKSTRGRDHTTTPLRKGLRCVFWNTVVPFSTCLTYVAPPGSILLVACHALFVTPVTAATPARPSLATRTATIPF